MELQQHKNDLQVSPFPPPFFSLRLSLNCCAHGCAAAWIVLLLLPETMWCLRLLLLVVLLPWSSSVKREHTPAGTPLITEWFGEVSSAPADAVSSAPPPSPPPPCRLIDETDELPATDTGRHSGQISQGPPFIGRRYNCMDEGWH